MQEYYRSGNYSLLEDIPFKEMFGRKSRVHFAEYLLECYLTLNKIIAYNGKIFSSELNRGEEYRDLKKVKQVVIIGKSTIKLEEKLLSKNYYKNESRRLSDMQEIDIIRIDKVGLSDHNKDNKRM